MKLIWHIYYATRGTSGAYIDALLKASGIAGVRVAAFVSANYRFSFGQVYKCFFPLTDFTEKRNTLLLVMRGLELVIAYLYVLALAVFFRPVIVIHLVDDLRVTYWFFKACKFLGLTVRITCHDVSSHYLGMNNIRARILVGADELIVHNDAALQILYEQLGKSVKNKIKMYPFPYSAYDEIIAPHKQDSACIKLRKEIGTGYYLFLGVVRRSKGIETLINSWSIFNNDGKERLVIAGKWTDPDEGLRIIADNDNTIAVIDRYVNDEEFVQLIQDAKLVVLPYQEYAHSAIIIACGNHGGAVVISDIDLFRQLLPDYSLTFKHGDFADLMKVLKLSTTLSQVDIDNLRQELKQAVVTQNETLVEDLREAYRS